MTGETSSVPSVGVDDLGIDRNLDLDPEKGADRLTARKKLFRVLVGVLIAASFAPWVYLYSGQADRDAPDLLEDRALATDAETICANALADIDDLPGALDAANGAERGEQVRVTTARYESMLDELDALPTRFERDEMIYRGWLSDWRVMTADRLAYADAITEDENARFLITDTGVDERLDRRLTRFANTNSMWSCIAPTDIG